MKYSFKTYDLEYARKNWHKSDTYDLEHAGKNWYKSDTYDVEYYLNNNDDCMAAPYVYEYELGKTYINTTFSEKDKTYSYDDGADYIPSFAIKEFITPETHPEEFI